MLCCHCTKHELCSSDLKVLFLDIDGVVNCATTAQRHRGAIGIDPYMALLVGRIIIATDCKVVLSSTWRLWENARREVHEQVCGFIDVTPTVHSSFRGDEVKAWLDAHPNVTKYAILDDNSDFLPDQPLFKTSFATGITQEIVDKVIAYFNEK